MIVFRLIKESLLFAIDSLVVNKLRTVLSLLGITIGIFAMVSVFTVVDSLENNIKNSVQSLGNDVIYIQKMPWNFSSDRPWWDYIRRPNPDYEEFKMVQKLTQSAEAVALNANSSGTLKYRNTSIENVGVAGVTHDFIKIWDLQIVDGRYFTELESHNGRPVAVVGTDIAENLFPEGNPVGKTFKYKGRKLTVIGVLKKEGESMVGQSNDKNMFMPLGMAANFFRINERNNGTSIMVKAKEGVSNLELMDELTGIMRSIRKLKPKAKDNFALNQMSMITQGIEGMFQAIHFAGFIIGIFSIIVGGFSIANIMFVSVKERTSIIGIQKSLGAKNYFVLLQFLFEAIFLCLIGGLVGLLFIFLGTLVLTYGLDFEVQMGLNNILTGIGISVVIGLISGFVPSWKASRLDPVEAIRAN